MMSVAGVRETRSRSSASTMARNSRSWTLVLRSPTLGPTLEPSGFDRHGPDRGLCPRLGAESAYEVAAGATITVAGEGDESHVHQGRVPHDELQRLVGAVRPFGVSVTSIDAGS